MYTKGFYAKTKINTRRLTILYTVEQVDNGLERRRLCLHIAASAEVSLYLVES